MILYYSIVAQYKYFLIRGNRRINKTSIEYDGVMFE